MKNIVVVSSSLRDKSTSKELALEVIKGLKENNNVELIDLYDIELNFCVGCFACQDTGFCAINDDVNKYLDLISNADILVFASPIYYYSIAGQLKTFLDRLNSLFTRKNMFKEVYTLFTCEDDNISAIEGPRKAIEGWVCCFDGVELKSSFNGLSVTSIGDITDKLRKEAVIFGKSIK